MWELSGHPCVHAMVALGCIRESTYDNWVDSCYLKETYLKAYSGCLNPILYDTVNCRKSWDLSHFGRLGAVTYWEIWNET